MERVKRRKLKFPCLFGGTKEISRCKTIQSLTLDNATTEQSLFESEVGNNTSKLANGISNEISTKTPSPSIFAKLMGRGGLSSYEDLEASHVADQHNSLQPGAKMKSQIKDMLTVRKNHDDVLCESNKIESKRHKPDSNSEFMLSFLQQPDSLFLKHLDDQKGQTVENGHVSLFEYSYFGDESLSGYRSKSMPCRITFHENDRLIHSLSNISERSLINEESNRMSERWKMTEKQNGVETINKCTTLGEIFSFQNKESRLEYEADEKEVVYSEPTSQGRIKGQIGSFNHDEDLPSKNVRYYKSYFENEGFAKHQPSISNIDYDCYKIETSFETSNNLVGDANSSGVDENGLNIFQLSGPESEYCESLKEVDHSSQFSLLEVPSDNESSDSDCFGRLNYQLQELKKQLHLLKVESTITSNDLTPTPKVKHLGQHSSITILESVSSSIYEIDPDTFTPSYQTIHYPKDPKFFYRLENYYYNGTVIPRSEKHLFYDYIQQTFIRTSKSMVTYSWVSPEKRESQLILTKFNLEDQIRKVVDEIEKEDDENFFAINYDKDPEWIQQTNEIDILGKVIAELVLHDLVLEVI